MKRKQTEYFMEFGDDRDPRSIEGRARLHQHHRERVVASILADLHLMAVADILPAICTVSAEKAYWQDFTGSEAKGTEAAHCVPCQIRITGRRPEQYVRKYSMDRADIIVAYFGKTDPFMPVAFNKCDSQSERLGLIDAFHDACIDAINSGYYSDFAPANVTTHIRNAFSIFKSGSKTAFEAAIVHFEDNKNYYQRNPAWADKAKESIVQLRIVRHYLKELRYSTAIGDIVRLGEINDLIKLYKGF